MAELGKKAGSLLRKVGSANRTSHQRWVVCAMLFFATLIAYIDRGVLAYLEKFLQSIIPGLNSVTYGYILACFQVAYAIGMVVAGGLADKIGTRKAFAIAIGLCGRVARWPMARATELLPRDGGSSGSQEGSETERRCRGARALPDGQFWRQNPRR